MAILAFVSIVLLMIAVPVVIVNRDVLFNRGAAGREIAESPLPFLIFPISADGAAIVPAGLGRSEIAEAGFQSDAAPEDRWASTDAVANLPAPEPLAAEPAAVITFAASPQRAEPPERVNPAEQPRRWPRALTDDEYDSSIAADATMVFNRPVDEAVQILPGRLRVLSGENTGQELRLFNRLGDPPRIVVGRESGPLHQHITLQSPTVSRRHARIELEDGCWTITNLSTTNPVLVNDSVLAKDGATRKLSDGDRIELGEVALRFLAS